MRRRTWPEADLQIHSASSGPGVGHHTRCKTSGPRDSQSHSSHIACLLPSRSWMPPVPLRVLVAWAVMVTQALSDNATNWLQLLLAVCYAAWSGRIPLETREMA